MVFPLEEYERNVCPGQCALRGRRPIHQFPVLSDGNSLVVKGHRKGFSRQFIWDS